MLVIPAENEQRPVAQLYRTRGLNIQIVGEAEDAAGYQVRELLTTHQIKVFASLEGFMAAYRVGDEEAQLLQCCRALIPAPFLMRTELVGRPPELGWWGYLCRARS